MGSRTSDRTFHVRVRVSSQLLSIRQPSRIECVRSKSGSNMSELTPVTEAELGGGKASSSISKMAGQGEGIYASPTSADVGIQQADQNGLTLSPKTKSRDKLSLETCMITDQDFEEALKQLESLSAEIEERTPYCHTHPIYDTRRRYVAALAKRRKLAGDLYEPSLQRPSSHPVIWPRSPTLNTVSPESAKNQQHNDIDETPCPKSSEWPLHSTDDRPGGMGACQQDIGSARLSTKKVQRVEETNSESAVLKSNHPAPIKGCEISTPNSDCVVSGKDLKGHASRFQRGYGSELSNYGIGHGKSAGGTITHGSKIFWNPDVPIQSIEREGQWLSINGHTGMRSSRSRSFDTTAVDDVSASFPWVRSQTIAGITNVAANETTRNFDTMRDSLSPSRKSSPTSTLAAIAKLFLQTSQQALVEDYSKSLSSHQIPAELQQYFHALLNKFHTDEQFQKSVIAYAMEVTGALSPGESDCGSIPAKLRQGFDSVMKRAGTDEKFKMSVQKFSIVYIRDKNSTEDTSSGTMGPEDDTILGQYKRKNLDGMSPEDLIKYCRELEESRAYHARQARSAREIARDYSAKADEKYRPLHQPKELCPNKGAWTCFNPQKATKNKNAELCGHSNPYFEKTVIWKEKTLCKECGGPYNKDDEGRELTLAEAPRKKYSRAKSKSKQAASAHTSQSPANAQSNDFHTPSMTQDLSVGAHSFPMYGNQAGDAQGYTRGVSDFEEHHNSFLSPGLLPSPLGHSSLSVNRTTTNDYHMLGSSLQNSAIRHTDNSPIPGLGFQNSNVRNNYPIPGSGFHNSNVRNNYPIPGSGFQNSNVRNNYPIHGSSFQNSAIRNTDDHPVFGSSFQNSNARNADNYPILGLGLQNPATDDYPIPGSGFQNPDIRNTDSLDLDMDFTGEMLGFDDFDINSDPLFLDMETHPSLQQPTSVLERTNTFQESLSQVSQNLTPPVGFYPSQMKLIPQHTGFQSQSQSSASSAHPLPTFTSVPSQDTMSGILGNYAHSATLDTASNLGQRHQSSTSLQAPVTRLTFPGAARNSPPPADQTQASGSSHQWPGPGRRRALNPILAETNKAQAKRAPSNADSPAMGKRAPAKKPRLSRAKEAVAERAASRDNVPRTAMPERPLTESQVNEVQARNRTSALFLGGRRKSWQESLENHQSRVVIEISSDTEEGEKEAEAEMAVSPVPQGAVADQDSSDAVDEALFAEFTAEFDRQDRAAALGEADGGWEEEEDDDEMGGDDGSRHNDRVIAVVAASVAAEESEESEEE